MKRDFTLLAVLWAVLAVVIAWGVSTFGWYLYPTHGAEEATIVDDAFSVLSYMAVPVVALVIGIELVAILRFRSKGEPTEDGPRITGDGNLPKFWLLITSALAVELAFLEFMEPPLAHAVDKLAQAGHRSITIAPLFMAQGGHLKHDLPKILEALRASHAGVTINLLPAVGDIEAILEAIAGWLVGAVNT